MNPKDFPPFTPNPEPSKPTVTDVHRFDVYRAATAYADALLQANKALALKEAAYERYAVLENEYREAAREVSDRLNALLDTAKAAS